MLSCEVVAYRRLKAMENVKRSAPKLVAVAYERFRIYSDLTGEISGNLEKWSPTGSGHKRRFYCIINSNTPLYTLFKYIVAYIRLKM